MHPQERAASARTAATVSANTARCSRDHAGAGRYHGASAATRRHVRTATREPNDAGVVDRQG